jgi:hypothetical protein
LKVFLVTEMKKKNSLHYELYGSSAGSEKKGYWRWAIFAGREKKPLLVGSFYGTILDAKAHAEEAKRLAQNSPAQINRSISVTVS